MSMVSADQRCHILRVKVRKEFIIQTLMKVNKRVGGFPRSSSS